MPSPPQPDATFNGPGSPINKKYAQAATDVRTEEQEQAVMTNIKRNILIHWALMPPQLNMLKPIDQLITTIHKCFPPAFNVQSHVYFNKWTPLTQGEIALSNNVMSNSPDEEKLKKAVKKIRFFLHPDKLPKDLQPEQEFMCKMLWDVTSDAWEDFRKQKEELDWIRG
uniref:J domain-containing protein n=1 Tax=Eucampia antarctica TaxID=49252 RepID=A0A7S2RN43_9STRA